MTWRETILTALGLYAPIRVHDQRVHDAANKEQIALSGLELARRQAERDIKSIVEAQKDECRSDEIRQTSATLRQSIEARAKKQDTLDAFVRGKRT